MTDHGKRASDLLTAATKEIDALVVLARKGETPEDTIIAGIAMMTPKITMAQVHATLNLAEQQRIANVIAWTTGDGYRPNAAAQAQIEEALGL